MLGTGGAKYAALAPVKGLVPKNVSAASHADATWASVLGAHPAKGGAGRRTTVLMTVFAHVSGYIPPFCFKRSPIGERCALWVIFRTVFPFVLDKRGEVGYNSTAHLYYIGNPNYCQDIFRIS